jgi:hypothetical protein
MSGGLHRVSVDEALKDWPYFEAHIVRTIARVDLPHTAEDILTCIQLGSMQLWRMSSCNAMCVTEIQTFTRYRLLLIYVVAGEKARDWLSEGSRQLAAFAQSHNCKYIDFHGRPGWERYARRYGFGRKLIVMRREL